ncbi:MAG: TraR/DksA family transcriptional regulator [Pseudomonadota bacterium]
MKNLSESELHHFLELLEQRRAELLQVEESGKAAADTVKLDQSSVGRLSRMDAMQAQAMSLETNRRRDLELRRISAALKRLDAGEYGYCLSCGEQIARGRLEFDPALAYCFDCASKAEDL